MYSSEQLKPHDPDHLFDDLSQTEDVARKLLQPDP
jgi:hypothetical protein